jgi:hypothetical protein
MTQRRLSYMDTREILRRLREKHSDRQIAREMKINRRTVGGEESAGGGIVLYKIASARVGSGMRKCRIYKTNSIGFILTCAHKQGPKIMIGLDQTRGRSSVVGYSCKYSKMSPT